MAFEAVAEAATNTESVIHLFGQTVTESEAAFLMGATGVIGALSSLQLCLAESSVMSEKQ